MADIYVKTGYCSEDIIGRVDGEMQYSSGAALLLLFM